MLEPKGEGKKSMVNVKGKNEIIFNGVMCTMDFITVVSLLVPLSTFLLFGSRTQNISVQIISWVESLVYPTDGRETSSNTTARH